MSEGVNSSGFYPEAQQMSGIFDDPDSVLGSPLLSDGFDPEAQQVSKMVDDADSVLGSPILAPAAFQNQEYQGEQIPNIRFNTNDDSTITASHEVDSLPDDLLDNSANQNRQVQYEQHSRMNIDSESDDVVGRFDALSRKELCQQPQDYAPKTMSTVSELYNASTSVNGLYLLQRQAETYRQACVLSVTLIRSIQSMTFSLGLLEEHMVTWLWNLERSSHRKHSPHYFHKLTGPATLETLNNTMRPGKHSTMDPLYKNSIWELCSHVDAAHYAISQELDALVTSIETSHEHALKKVTDVLDKDADIRFALGEEELEQRMSGYVLVGKLDALTNSIRYVSSNVQTAISNLNSGISLLTDGSQVSGDAWDAMSREQRKQYLSDAIHTAFPAKVPSSDLVDIDRISHLNMLKTIRSYIVLEESDILRAQIPKARDEIAAIESSIETYRSTDISIQSNDTMSEQQLALKNTSPVTITNFKFLDVHLRGLPLMWIGRGTSNKGEVNGDVYITVGEITTYWVIPDIEQIKSRHRSCFERVSKLAFGLQKEHLGNPIKREHSRKITAIYRKINDELKDKRADVVKGFVEAAQKLQAEADKARNNTGNMKKKRKSPAKNLLDNVADEDQSRKRIKTVSTAGFSDLRNASKHQTPTTTKPLHTIMTPEERDDMRRAVEMKAMQRDDFLGRADIPTRLKHRDISEYHEDSSNARKWASPTIDEHTQVKPGTGELPESLKELDIVQVMKEAILAGIKASDQRTPNVNSLPESPKEMMMVGENKWPLLPHQLQFIGTALKQEEESIIEGRDGTTSVILADEIGLGKTIQMLSLVWYTRHVATRCPEHAKFTTLLVAPGTLIQQRQTEADSCGKEFRIFVFHDIHQSAPIPDFADYDMVITTYGVLQRQIQACLDYERDWVLCQDGRNIMNDCYYKPGDDGEGRRLMIERPFAPLVGQKWDRIILDEAGKIRNQGTKVFQTLQYMSARIWYCLTGTPTEK